MREGTPILQIPFPDLRLTDLSCTHSKLIFALVTKREQIRAFYID